VLTSDLLSKIWPQFDEQKLIRFSTSCAMREAKIDEDYINTEYKHILEVLHSVYNEAINERIKVTYKLGSVLVCWGQCS
jgi:hypothetical protein